MKETCKLAWNFIRYEKSGSRLTFASIFICVFFISSCLIFLRANDDFEIRQSIYLHSDYELFYSDLQDKEKFNEYLAEKYPDKDYISEVLRLYKAGDILDQEGKIELISCAKVPENYALSLQIGHYPAKENEIMVSHLYLERNHLKLGDTIRLAVNYNSEYSDIPYEDTKEYTITATYHFGRFHEGYVDRMYTYSHKEIPVLFSNGFIKLQNMTLDEMNAFAEDLHDQYITSLIVNEIGIQLAFGTYETVMLKPFLKVFAILLVVVMQSMLTVFLLSWKLKEGNYNILKSIGATKKQIFAISLWESMLYTLIAIPIAYLTSIVVMHLFFQFAYTIMPIDTNPFPHRVMVTALDVSLVVGVNLVTLLICNLVPLFHIQKGSIIQSLKHGEKVRKVRNYRMLEKLFGFEAQIARRNQKRNRFSYYSIAFTIIISVIFMISGYYYEYTCMRQLGITKGLEFIVYVIMGIMFMLTLLVAANLYFLISANIKLRKKESMILASVGLTRKQLLTMLFLENGVIILKSLIIGILLSQVINYIVALPSWYTFVIDIPIIIFVVTLILGISIISIYINYRKLIKTDMISNIK